MAKKETYQDIEPGYEPDRLYLYDWIFHFNPYTEMWAAIPRDLNNEYWVNYKHDRIIKSSNIITLLELLQRSKGDLDILEKLVNDHLK